MVSRAALTVVRRGVMFTWAGIRSEQAARDLAADAVDLIESIFPGAFYTVCVEYHREAADPLFAWHVHLGLVREQGCKPVKIGRRLDLHQQLVHISPHGCKRHDLEQCLKYPLKEDECAYGNWDDLDAPFRRPGGTNTVAISSARTSANRGEGAFSNALQAGGYAQALACIREGASRDYVLYFTKIEAFFKQRFAPVYTHKYLAASFNRPLVDWSTLTDRQSLLIIGPTNMGKTHYALAHFEQPLFVTHLDQLRNFNPSIHGGIVVDDVSMTEWEPTALIAIFDRDFARSIHCRYKNPEIPAGTKKIFCSNNLAHFLPGELSKVDQDTLDAITSRQFVVHVTTPLFTKS